MNDNILAAIIGAIITGLFGTANTIMLIRWQKKQDGKNAPEKPNPPTE